MNTNQQIKLIEMEVGEWYCPETGNTGTKISVGEGNLSASSEVRNFSKTIVGKAVRILTAQSYNLARNVIYKIGDIAITTLSQGRNLMIEITARVFIEKVLIPTLRDMFREGVKLIFH